jgi:hypothetical protein
VARGQHVVILQSGNDVGADLAGRAGDEDAHGSEVYGPRSGSFPMGRSWSSWWEASW